MAVCIFALYWIAWLLPVIGKWEKPGTYGWEGALFEHEILMKGLATLFGSPLWDYSPETDGIFLSISRIYMGLPNILFVLGFILYFWKPVKSYNLYALGFPSMVYWGVLFYGEGLLVGYYLWAVSGLAMFLLTATQYAWICEIRFRQLFVRRSALFFYVPILWLAFGIMLNIFD